MERRVVERIVQISDGRSGRKTRVDATSWASRFRLLLDLSRDAFIETDRHGVLTEWNRQSELLFGWSRDEVIGRSIEDLLVPDRFARRFADDFGTALAMGDTERTRPRELRLLHRAGYEVPVHCSAYVVGSGAGLRIGGFVRDMSRDSAAEEALAHAYLHDSLTRLGNRTLFTYSLSYALAQAHNSPTQVAVIVLDLDRFKAINDGLGHEVGDQVLVEV